MGQPEAEFETLESAHDFLKLLAKAVTETRQELEGDVLRESVPSRRMDALRLAQYDLDKLETHLTRSCRIINDLRTLRRLLFEEREASRKKHLSDTMLPIDPSGDAALPKAVAA